jgi:hypothetical protein
VANVPVTLQGTVQTISAAKIEVLVDAPDKKNKVKNQPKGQWTVINQPETKLVVTGEANPDYLHSGLTVQFYAEVAGPQVQDKIGELTVLGAGKVKTGIFAADGSVEKSNGHEAAEVPVAGSQASKVVGRLGHVQGSKWPVRAGSRSLGIELSDQVKIKVTLNNAHLIASGDRITVQGRMVKGKSGSCVADQVEVTLSRLLSSPRKPAKALADKSSAAESAKDNDEPAKTESDNEEIAPKQ